MADSTGAEVEKAQEAIEELIRTLVEPGGENEGLGYVAQAAEAIYCALVAPAEARATAAEATAREMREDNARMLDENTELKTAPWPDWAKRISDKMVEFGVIDGRDLSEGIDLADVFSNWLEGFEAERAK